MSDKVLTIGAATFDDFEGVFFTFQAIRLANLERLESLDLVVIDNNPTSAEGMATADFCDKANIRYFPEPTKRTTAIRDRIFREALAPWAMSIDPHVLFEPNTISKLIYYVGLRNKHCKDILHGPMLYDYLGDETPATHMEPVWRDNMFGTWGHDERGKDPAAEQFEIPMHGLGLFACRVDAWPGFSPLFRGFGGEEGYIHEKIRAQGGKAYCLPFLRWVHRFQRPRGINYPLNIAERVHNYCVGWLETGQDPQEVLDHFATTHPGLDAKGILEKAQALATFYENDPDAAIDQIHPPEIKLAETQAAEIIPFKKPDRMETWHDTDINFGNILELEILGRKLRISKASISWAIR